MTIATRAAAAKPESLEAELLAYDPETGILTWLPRSIEHFTTANHMRTWNTRFSGKQAFASRDQEGYMTSRIFGRHRLAHRVIWAIVYGDHPDGEIDHIDGDRGNNRLSNLRVVKPIENQRNKCRGKNNTSGVMGVSWNDRDRRWLARININGKAIHLGRFAEKSAAISARKHAEREYGFHPNHGRATSSD